MKRLLIIILLIIFSLPAMGQYDLFGQYNNPFSVWGSKTKTPAGGNYVQRAWDFFNAVTAKGKTLTDAQKRWYNDSLFVPGIAHGYIGTTRAGDSLVALYSFSLRWAGDSTVANMNLLDPTGSYNCIHYGVVTYTDSGVVGDGSSGYLNTFFNASSDSAIVRALSTSIGIYSKTDNAGNLVDMGVMNDNPYPAIEIKLLFSNNAYTAIGGGASNVANDNSLGVYISSRVRYQTINLYKNGTSIAAFANNYTVTPAFSVYISARNYTGTAQLFTSRIYPFAFIGSGLSSTMSKNLSDDLNNALKGAGYNVY